MMTTRMKTMIDQRKLVVVSAPSGCGKDTIVRNLRRYRSDIRQSVSCTTRKPREGEQHGVNYYYISREEFLQRLENGRMLEYNEYAGNLYGTPRDELEQLLETGDTVVLVIDVNGAVNVKKVYPDALLVFLLPPSIDALTERLSGRGSEAEAVIEQRMEIAKQELAQVGSYDISIVNDDIDRCTEELSAAIDAWQTIEKT